MEGRVHRPEDPCSLPVSTDGLGRERGSGRRPLQDPLLFWRTTWAADGFVLLALGLLLLLAFWHIGPAGRVIAGGDLFTYFYPYWAEAARALRAGRLPLWNPYLFAGAPFLANSQAGVLYPLNWPFWLLLPAHWALHGSALFHLWLAGSGAYLYARRVLRLGRLGAWTAGVAFALGGHLSVQIEHINQLQALAWLPWALFLYDEAVFRSSDGAAAVKNPFPLVGGWLALVVALILLAGHTQSAFIVLVGLGVNALIPRAGVSLRRRLAILTVGVGLGVALAAAQLVPTLELARESVRSGGLPFKERVSFSLSPVYLARALLPSFGRPIEPENLEYVGYIGVTGLLLVLWALRLLLSRSLISSFPRSSAPLLLSLFGLFLSLGLYNPVYLLLARFVPGFAHFRAPARWLVLWAFGAAVLAGVGVDELRRGAVSDSQRKVGISLALVLFFLWGALGGHADWQTVVGWGGVAVLAGALLLLPSALIGNQPRLGAGCSASACADAEDTGRRGPTVGGGPKEADFQHQASVGRRGPTTGRRRRLTSVGLQDRPAPKQKMSVEGRPQAGGPKRLTSVGLQNRPAPSGGYSSARADHRPEAEADFSRPPESACADAEDAGRREGRPLAEGLKRLT
ncbi:MAG: hypothetical protein RMK65_03445, partial [Anaerolineae bacterium]|nr:hypothetical protein [Anaerolineae bacterium]